MFRPAIVLTVLFTALTGLGYPLAMTAVAQLAFPTQANARTLGAVAQSFTGPEFFSGRPSATTPPCNAESSTGSNLGPTNPAFLAQVTQRVAQVRAQNAQQNQLVPADLVTASGSGLDPHLSPEAARYQVPRIARARGVSEQLVGALIDEHLEGRWLGIFGEPRVNVVRLNAALVQVAGSK
jgi:K+-transporting ATPase ATPase C chain